MLKRALENALLPPPFSLLWGLLFFKTAKTSMQVYLKDEGIF